MSITGQTCVSAGVPYAYSIAGPWTGSTNMSWSSTGTITGSQSGTPLIQVTVTFTRSGSVSVTTSNPSGSASLNVYVNTGLSAGTVSNTSQTINYNTIPASINCSAATLGGCSAPSFVYQWQSSTDNVSFTDIAGATSQNLSFISALVTTTYYRRFVKETTTNNTAYSNVATVIVNPPTDIQPLVPGTVTPATQTINYGSNAAQLSITGVSGGTGVYTYQWQSSPDNAAWNNIAATGTTFTPASLTLKTYYRVLVTSYQTTGPSSSTVVNIYPPLISGMITPAFATIVSGGKPGKLTALPATGGNGTYTYQWQNSTDGTTFTNISGATSITYVPGSLTSNTWYRLKITSNGASVFSNAVPVTVSSTSPDLNMIQLRQILKPGVTDSSMAAALTSPNDVAQTSEYFDGLGRPVQTVDMQQSPLQKDIVKFTVYDAFGREMFKYLPYVASKSDGNYKSTFQGDQYDFNISQYPDETFFYSQTNFEASPINRPVTTYAPGTNWLGTSRGTTIQYLLNTVADSVQAWNINAAQGSLPIKTTPYSAGTLYKTITTDESGHKVIEYKDFDGKVVLKKVQQAASPGTAHVGWLCTYYIYDILGNLRFVIPPLAVQLINNNWTVSTTIANNLCYRYDYDQRNRMIIKKIPGTDEVWMVYDTRDRLVYTQDGNMRGENWWLATLYDDQNRPVQTGMMTYSNTLSALQTYVSELNPVISSVSAAGTGIGATIDNLFINQRDPQRTSYQATNSVEFDGGFTSEDGASFTAQIITATPPSYSGTQTTYNVAQPSGSSFVPLTMNFYDDYSFTTKAYNITNNSKLDIGTNSYGDVLPSAASVMTRGLPTGTRVRAIENASDLTQGKWMETVNFYDDKGRGIQSQSDNYKGGTEFTTNRYSFAGNVITSYVVHNNAAAGITNLSIKTNMNYDARARLLNIQKSINDGAVKTTVVNTYDELGQLKTKSLGTDPDNVPNPLETLTYDYNIHGWLLGVNRSFAKNTSTSYTNHFGFDLGYDKTSISISGGTAGSYATAQYNGNIAGIVWRSAGDGEIRKYDFSYDNANRLTIADFNQYTSNSFNKTANVNFSVSNLTYDVNGNILSMRQMGLKPGGSSLVDDLGYNYLSTGSSNQLQYVTDASNDAQTVLGDFRYSPSYTASLGSGKTTSTVDYTYDVNGNLTKDNNKDISSITYNYLNLPAVITVTAKGTMTYIYDALGNKLEKRVVDNTATPSLQTTTTYLSNFVYQNNLLQYFGHEEGRIRKAADAVTFTYDYFLKDHLGNVRMVLTEEQKTDAYPTLDFEGSSNTAAVTNQDAVWSNSSGGPVDVVGTRIARPANMGTSATDSSYTKLITKSSSGGAIGAAMLLKVMSGDQINTSVDYYWPSNTVNNSHADGIGTLTTSLLTALVNSSAVSAAVKGSVSTINSGLTADPNVISAIMTPENNTSASSQPKAYLHVLFFNEQFIFDNVNSVVQQIGATSNVVATISKVVTVKKNGYAYVYFSNESDNSVYFDNFKLTDVRGPELEETHYYPFGLSMAGISSQALSFGQPENNKLYNKGSELQHHEFSDGSGLELYSTEFRSLDPQLGRWWQVDPKCDAGINPDVANDDEEQDEAEVGGFESISPYVSMGNDPIRHNDPNGDIFGIDNFVGAVVGAVVEVGTQVVSNAISGEKLTNISWGKVGVAAVEGFVTDGTSNVTKALVNVGGAIVNSAIDNHGKGAGAIVKGAVVNLAVDKVAGSVSKLTKGVGGKTLNNVADKVVGSKSKIIDHIVANNNITHKTASTIAKVVNSGEKAVAKQVVRQANQNVTKAVAGGAVDAAQKKILDQK